MISQTPYEAIGGEETIRKLVNAFYLRVAKDPLLRPIFPEDLTLTTQKQFMFLTQFLGGEPLYSNVYGHPMMRARHMRFQITPKRAERWLALMKEAMDEIGMEGPAREYMYQRLIQVAHHMVNSPDDETTNHLASL
ncbi:globin [Aneurinibacillus thermoaerophilus]|uniref:Globin n=1 Tax=Aneurinibacillus thermoaerophilus TaxID=143495 RepID=A0ABX8YEG3_ANETH|nr:MULTISPECIES: globin [Aneurinibacillus]AMA73719.1 globin [Aneurinibacillus sp. XH2]QYY43714.1 globin [Aneurinibacillus thermoaerophilus]